MVDSFQRNIHAPILLGAETESRTGCKKKRTEDEIVEASREKSKNSCPVFAE